MVLSPRESGEFIAKNAKLVKVHEAGIDKLAGDVLAGLKDGTIDPKNFSQNELHPKPQDSDAPNWLLLIDTLNFCFWTAGKKQKWQVEGHTGYFALCAAINRAKRDGVDITNPNFYSKITQDQLKNILRSDDATTVAPLLEQRVACLHEVGTKLMEKYDGKFENFIKSCNKSAQNLLQLIVTEFPCFRDEAQFHGERVAIYKRAQILVGDIWSCYCGEGLGEFNDIETITMFADYRVPQVLVHYGCMEYTQELLDTLKEDKLLENGSQEEVEIRGISIYVVEELKKKLVETIKENDLNIDLRKVNSILLDHYLWDYRRKYAAELEYIPFHKVLCVYY
ncbi:unnamed protein product [Hermetia illucens]|uniref:Queuosine 5'-phosphate N-glycosylase/hydrolase n=2 Tax=Hermetia illucens TaxID=343691 RepID=A0A7R8V3U0_HERIL|nr:unnamed protein product [Hermetia illucens]